MIRYTESIEGVRPEDLNGFFEGWRNAPSRQTHRRILENSLHVVLAVDESSKRVVGFITAVGDGVLSAYIPLLEVHTDYQGEGIGSELLRRMLERLEHLYMVDLVCDEDVVGFYERHDLMRATAMIRRNFDWRDQGQ